MPAKTEPIRKGAHGNGDWFLEPGNKTDAYLMRRGKREG
jgi:hypothetical protein